MSFASYTVVAMLVNYLATYSYVTILTIMNAGLEKELIYLSNFY